MFHTLKMYINIFVFILHYIPDKILKKKKKPHTIEKDYTSHRWPHDSLSDRIVYSRFRPNQARNDWQ